MIPRDVLMSPGFHALCFKNLLDLTFSLVHASLLEKYNLSDKEACWTKIDFVHLKLPSDCVTGYRILGWKLFFFNSFQRVPPFSSSPWCCYCINFPSHFWFCKGSNVYSTLLKTSHTHTCRHLCTCSRCILFLYILKYFLQFWHVF